MGLFLEAAKSWKDLHNVKYIFKIAKKGKLTKIELSFCNEDFPHLAGMQYSNDVDFGINKAEYYGELLVPALLKGYIDDSKIEKSRNWQKIQGRLSAIIKLQTILDSDFKIVAFNRYKVRGYSEIEAKFVITDKNSEDVFFVFLDKKTDRYYCKSAFKKELTDYTGNQTSMHILRKVKIIDNIEKVLFTHPNYNSDCF